MSCLRARVASILIIALLAASCLSGCSGCQSDQTEQVTGDHSGLEGSYANTAESAREDSQELLGVGIEKAEGLAENVESAIDEAETAEPVRAELGEWVEATENLAVTVDDVEEGPFDHADQMPTMKVTVSMRNLTDHTVTVKASNWNADNTDGQRVDHKLWLKDDDGNIADRSFELTRISPGSTFTGVVYFDGNGLVDVVYEPHWLVSRQNQYIYFQV